MPMQLFIDLMRVVECKRVLAKRLHVVECFFFGERLALGKCHQRTHSSTITHGCNKARLVGSDVSEREHNVGGCAHCDHSRGTAPHQAVWIHEHFGRVFGGDSENCLRAR